MGQQTTTGKDRSARRKDFINNTDFENEQIRRILESLTDGFFALDNEWRFIYINHKTEEFLHKNREDLLGRSIWDEFPQAANSTFYEQCQKAVSEQADVKFEHFYPPLEAWFEVFACPSPDGLSVYFNDITERKLSEEALRESEANYRAIFDAVDDAIMVHDIETGEVLDVNRKTCEMYACTAEEARKLITQGWSTGEAPYTAHDALDRIQRAASGEPQFFEWRAIDKTGRGFWVEVSLKRTRIGGKDRVLGVVRDISLRKEEEEQLREQAALLDHATDAIIVQDLEGEVLYWNKSAERMYGWKASEAKGKNVRDLYYKENPSQYRAARNSLLKDGVWFGEIRQYTKDGKEITAECHWTLVPGDGGKPKSMFAINTDITERKKLEAQFLRAQRMESIGALASGIAHNLGNLLSPILLSIQMLKRKFTDEESQHMLAILQINAERGGEMIRQVLEFARGIEGERIELQPTHLIKEVARILESTFPKTIDIKVSIAQDLSHIVGDATQMHQVLMNLCVNARDAMPKGGSLTIKAENIYLDENYARMHFEANQGHYVMISVADTGIGMTAEVIEKIYEPFFTTKEQGKGTGLGLPSIRGLVKGHGGFIDVLSEVGKGTEFRIYIPAATSIEVRPDEAAPSGLPAGHGELILIVDDEAPLLEVARKTLEENGYRVLTGRDGTEALAIYAERKKEIDAVVMDMVMPYLDGAATIRAMQRLNPEVRVIGSSGLSSNDKTFEVADEGTRIFLKKPYTAEKLLRALAEILGTT
ncbi:MAG TPA: PAS domain S-box protein [Blastocatellia bacterium]|jgi:PAS domain S-box-containing protein